MVRLHVICLFFFNDTATTEIYTLSLPDALPISAAGSEALDGGHFSTVRKGGQIETPADRDTIHERRAAAAESLDRKSTRLNSSHSQISYAVFCLKKKKKRTITTSLQLPYSNERF